MTEEPRVKSSAPVVLVNVFTPRPGKLDELLAFQAEELRTFARSGRFPGWMGSRWLRSLDGIKAVNVTMYESMEAHNRVKESFDFSEHRRRVERLVESVEGGFYAVEESIGYV
jgi:hypothetical protein